MIDLLSEYAPTIAVAGNNDGLALADQLGTARVVQVEQWRIGITHGHLGHGRTTPERALTTFRGVAPAVDAICFGHSHIPLVEQRNGLWLLNPGSPTDRRRQPEFSYLVIELENGRLEPRLVTYASRS